MSDATVNWLLVLLGVITVGLMIKTYLDVTGFD